MYTLCLIRYQINQVCKTMYNNQLGKKSQTKLTYLSHFHQSYFHPSKKKVNKITCYWFDRLSTCIYMLKH